MGVQAGGPEAAGSTATRDVPAARSGRLAGFVLGRRLGRGSMGDVYLAREATSERVVALKLLRDGGPDAARALESEARLAASIDHPNVVRIHDVGVQDDVAWMAMEYVEGQDLEELLAERGWLGWEEALSIADAVAAAVAAAHEQGVVHRDLKPANIRLGADGRPRVMDFGIASAAGPTEGRPLLGTPSYLPPEVARGERVDARADLYSLGVVLFRLLTGRLPFVADDVQELVRLHLEAPPPAVRSLAHDVPAALDRLVHRLLAKAPADRPASASEVRVELAAVRAAAARPLARLAGRVARWLWPRPAPAPRPVAAPRSPIAACDEGPDADPRREALRAMRPRIRGLVPRSPGSARVAGLAPVELGLLDQVRLHVERRAMALPLLPRATLDLQTLLGDARASLPDVARLIASDPVLMAQVLRAANSAAYGALPTTDPALAVVRIGQRGLRTLMLELTAKAVMLRGKSVGALARRLWDHSLGCAVLSRRLGALLGEDAEACYTAGLLHDVGMVPILDAVLDAARVLGITPSEDVVVEALDRWHGDVGARVVVAWGLPSLVAATGRHHEGPPTQGESPLPRLAGIVALADALCSDPTVEAATPGLLQAAGCERQVVVTLLEGLDGLLSEVEQRLNG